MAWEAHLDLEPGAYANADFSGANGGTTEGYGGTGQYLFVKRVPGTPNAFVPCSSKYDLPAGVSQDNGNSGDALGVATKGYTKIVAGGVLVEGDEVGCDANGRCVKKQGTSTGANLGEFIAGEVVEGTANPGELATIRLKGAIIV